MEAIKAAKKAGVTISCDLNFRKNLWKWGSTAKQVMPAMVDYCDVILGNEEDAEKVFDIKPDKADVSQEKLKAPNLNRYAKSLRRNFLVPVRL